MTKLGIHCNDDASIYERRSERNGLRFPNLVSYRLVERSLHLCMARWNKQNMELVFDFFPSLFRFCQGVPAFLIRRELDQILRESSLGLMHFQKLLVLTQFSFFGSSMSRMLLSPRVFLVSSNIRRTPIAGTTTIISGLIFEHITRDPREWGVVYR